MVFLKILILKRTQQTKKPEKLPSMQRVQLGCSLMVRLHQSNTYCSHLACWLIFMLFLSADFFQNKLFQKIIYRTLSDCQMVWIQHYVGPDMGKIISRQRKSALAREELRPNSQDVFLKKKLKSIVRSMSPELSETRSRFHNDQLRKNI